MSGQFIKTGEIARALQVSPKTISRWAERGAMPAPVRIAGTVRFEAEAVETWMADGCPAADGDEQGSEQ
jgi:excisionase family DNA binding protein